MRFARVNGPGIVFHVVSRFVDRHWFLRDDEERQNYVRLLAHALERSDWRCLAYALMSNHIHLAMVGGNAPMSSWLKRVHSPFANWMNRRHGRLGPIFAGRPKQWAMRPEHEGRLIAYIHNNPVRAGVVSHARYSTWTSHRAYIGHAVTPSWLQVEEGLMRCWRDVRTFDTWVNGDETTLEAENAEGIYVAARRRGGLTMGTPTSPPISVPLLARRASRIRPDPAMVILTVESITGVSSEMFRSRNPAPPAIAARRLVVRCGVALGLSGSELADSLGVSPQTVSRTNREPLTEEESAIIDVVARRLWMSTTDDAPVFANPLAAQRRR